MSSVSGIENPASPNDGTFQTSGGGSPSGLVLDLTVVTQLSTGTVAYRERVVPGGDDGSIQTFRPDGSGSTAAVVAIVALERMMGELLMESRRQKQLLRLMLDAMVKKNVPTDDDLDDLEDS